MPLDLSRSRRALVVDARTAASRVLAAVSVGLAVIALDVVRRNRKGAA